MTHWQTEQSTAQGSTGPLPSQSAETENPLIFSCNQSKELTSCPKINIRPSVLFTSYTPCKINNKNLRSNPDVCHGHVRINGHSWCSLSAVHCCSQRHSASCYSASNVFSSRPAVRGLSVHFSVFGWVFCQHVRGRFSIFILSVCVCKWARHGDQTVMVGSQLLKPGSTRSSLLPLSFGREYKTETEVTVTER